MYMYCNMTCMSIHIYEYEYIFTCRIDILPMLAASPYYRQIFQGSTVFIQREVFVHVDLTEGLFKEVLDIVSE